MCAMCGRSPALGFASVTVGYNEVWFCHPDEGPSCYMQFQISEDILK